MGADLAEGHNQFALIDDDARSVWEHVVDLSASEGRDTLAIRPRHVAGFRAGYVAHLEQTLRSGELERLLEGFVEHVGRQLPDGRHPAGAWEDEAKRSAREVLANIQSSIHDEYCEWLQAETAEVDRDGLVRPLREAPEAFDSLFRSLMGARQFVEHR